MFLSNTALLCQDLIHSFLDTRDQMILLFFFRVIASTIRASIDLLLLTRHYAT